MVELCIGKKKGTLGGDRKNRYVNKVHVCFSRWNRNQRPKQIKKWELPSPKEETDRNILKSRLKSFNGVRNWLQILNCIHTYIPCQIEHPQHRKEVTVLESLCWRKNRCQATAGGTEKVSGTRWLVGVIQKKLSTPGSERKLLTEKRPRQKMSVCHSTHKM